MNEFVPAKGLPRKVGGGYSAKRRILTARVSLSSSVKPKELSHLEKLAAFTEIITTQAR
jgi:hypothetical protein